ncbi:hypothetical protein MLD38_015322 [Melastoma candidum]|uniref:Uncharacterized protein n=1 Tax=Melastoma candidum TaxID=119954 RepID=A0ACB9RHN2_9MYRT|nr:hypothetical protein MLD38_015322 [Melastoma candidum]
MQVLVDQYPAWGDTVQVETWVSESGTNRMRRDGLVRDIRTGEVVTRASGLWVLMNKKTGRLSKITEEVRREIEPYFMNTDPVVEDDERKLIKLDEKIADIIRSGLTVSHWSIFQQHSISPFPVVIPVVFHLAA